MFCTAASKRNPRAAYAACGLTKRSRRSLALGAEEGAALEINLGMGRLPLTRELSAQLTEGEKMRLGKEQLCG